MTGSFYFRTRQEPLRSHTHVEFLLDNGESLGYRDTRRFGRLWWFVGAEEPDPFPLAQLGPDALSVPQAVFREILRTRRRMMKPLLLDQHLVAGLGNIYVDEILFRSRIHPNQPSHRIGDRKAFDLWGVMRSVLLDAIEKGGSSIRDYVDTNGRMGDFQKEHLVYGRAGNPCPRCGRPLKRILVAQRGTCFCPRCQRLRK